MEKLAVGVKEAADLASVGVPTVNEWLARGLPHTRTKGGGKIIILVSDLETWIANETRVNAEARA